MSLKIKVSVVFVLVITTIRIQAQQLQTINGKVKAVDDVEGVHILNVSSNVYTTSNEVGEFSINVKLNDTILVSSIKYYSKTVIIDQSILASSFVEIQLIELVNELDEVTVGKILTGDLLSDIKNSDVERPINFYDVGIPGNTNLPLTQNERRLFEADHGKFVYLGLGLAINVNKILNRVSGRTRRLKELVALDERDNCMEKARLSFATILFSESEFKEEEILAFFFFASEDEAFKEICLMNNNMAMFEFLENKKSIFVKNLRQSED